MAFIKPEAAAFLCRVVEMIAADGIIEPAEERYFNQTKLVLGLTDAEAGTALHKLGYYKAVAQIRTGQLPTVAPRSKMHLDASEICHLDTDAEVAKAAKGRTRRLMGQLVATSKTLYWSHEGEFTQIPFNTILLVQMESTAVRLGGTKRTAPSHFYVTHPHWVEAVIDTLVRIHKRQILVGERDVRTIPHDMKIAVWQRDCGKCVECAANDYLEFDHVIPHSKGGATSLENIQLLCRRCNGKKSDRI